MDSETVLKSFDILLKFQQCDIWEVRHGSLLGLKYLIAVRKDLIEIIVPQSIDPILKGLGDTYDDVRAVASDALLPVTEEVSRICIDRLPKILSILWDILLDLDDLTASTNSVMNLLAEFYSMPITADATYKMLEEKQQLQTTTDPLATLVPRLWPFLLHNIASVRLATLKTLIKLFSINHTSNSWMISIIPSGLQYTFQTILLETKPEIIQSAIEFWKIFISKMDSKVASESVEQLIELWLNLLSTPVGCPLNTNGLIIPEYSSLSLSMEGNQNKQQQQQQQQMIDLNSDDDDGDLILESKSSSKGRKGKKTNNKRKRSYKSKDTPSKKKFRSQDGDVIDVSSTAQIQSKSTPLMRDNGCDALGFLFNSIPIENLLKSYSYLQTFLTQQSGNQRLIAGLILESIGNLNNENNQEKSLPDEIYNRLLEILSESVNYSELFPYSQQMLNDYNVLIQSMISFGAPANVFQRNFENIDMKIIHYTATTQFCQFMEQLSNHIDESTKGQLNARQQQLLSSIDQIQNLEIHYTTSIRGVIASVIVAWKKLPQQLNPIIRSLMNGIKKESVQSLQKRFAFGIASLIKQIINRKPCPNSKIISNICSSISTNIQPNLQITESSDPPTLQVQNNSNSSAMIEKEISHRGAEYSLESLAKVFDDKLFDQLPTLKNILLSIQSFISKENNDFKKLLEILQIYLILLPVVSPKLHGFFLENFPLFFTLVQNSKTIQRTAIARVVGMYCKIITLDCMKLVISDLLPFLSKTNDENARLGVSECIQFIIEYLDMKVIPYIVFLVVPTLGRMSDPSICVRKLVTNSFATLVRLMPLESGIEDPDGFTEQMKIQKQNERRFLEQLLDGSKLDQYTLPIPVNAQLRKYQQEGLNWLAFLQKYKLHGILCDDMGLGKTLQTLCIVVSDNYQRKQNFEKTKNPEHTILPSMIVCPPTVVGHWFHETKKFFDKYAKAILYTGTPSERSAIRDDIVKHDIIICSYDILRNDIQFLEQIYWNYCVLDEGHIIRNSKTKITQAAKKINANHRLILSGTPIQNNVLELWSLFDFLMPGFLGTEKQFNQIYGKPIIASRDPKCSQRDQERGTFALESLHRQVLPFLLRRVKEDVLHDLPPKIIQDYYCELSTLQKRLYEDFATSPTCKDIQSNISSSSSSTNTTTTVAEPQTKKKKSTHIFQALQYLRKLCNHPLLVLNPQHPEYHSVMSSLAKSNDSLHSLNHAPKLMALKELLTECGIGNHNSSSSSNLNASSSQNNNLEIVPSASIVQHRVLIFAQLKKMLDIIEKDLLKQFFPSVSYLRLDGGVHTNKRHDIVTQFNDDPTIDILLLTTHVGGLGLNLTGADTVIFVEHDWNPMKDLQAMDRAHRLGQTKVVNVYRLITKGTLEEKIMGLQKFKLNIANSVVNQENSSLRTMDTNQLLDLFDVSSADDKQNSNDNSGVDEFGNLNSSTKKQTANQVVENLEELWDETVYSEEYDLDNFVSSLKK